MILDQLKTDYVQVTGFNRDGKDVTFNYTFEIGPRGRVFQSAVINDAVSIIREVFGDQFEEFPTEYTFDGERQKGTVTLRLK